MRPRILLALLIPAVLACESRMLPQPEPDGAETFVLEEPVVLQWSSVRATLLADTLRLNPDGSALRSGRTHFDYDDYRDTTVHMSSPYRHHTEGPRIELEFVCPPNALCAPPPHLWGLAGSKTLVLKAAEDPRPTLRYRRIWDQIVPFSK